MENVSFQNQVWPWVVECFGAEIATDKKERNQRFGEETLELLQACGATAQDCHQLVDYVFSRPPGDPDQEVGGVMVTLASLCLAHGLDMQQAGDRELADIWTKIDAIRAKYLSKPQNIRADLRANIKADQEPFHKI